MRKFMRTLIYLKRRKEKKIKNSYPLLFADEIKLVKFGAKNEVEIADVFSFDGEFIGRGYFFENARIPLRILTRKRENIDEQFFQKRFSTVFEQKKSLILNSNSFRLIHGEADGFPGLIIDLYDKVAIVQVRTAGMEYLKQYWLPALIAAIKPDFVFEKSDMKNRLEEQLRSLIQPLAGIPVSPLIIEENGFRFEVDYENGLKTGFYLDQRANREIVTHFVNSSDTVLDLFTYSGAFSVYLSKHCKQITAVDIDTNAIKLAKANFLLNHVSNINLIEANAFEFLEESVLRQDKYDLIILDPPAIAKSKAKKASLKWAIWKLAYSAFQCLNPKARVAVFNCSYQLNDKEFNEALRLAAGDTQKKITVLREFKQDIDHTWLLQFPESLYLRGYLLRVDNA